MAERIVTLCNNRMVRVTDLVSLGWESVFSVNAEDDEHQPFSPRDYNELAEKLFPDADPSDVELKPDGYHNILLCLPKPIP